MSIIRIKWLSCASFEIDIDGKAIVTDPFITHNPGSPCTQADVERCDLMTLSHGHYDHITDFPALAERFPDAPILCGPLTAMPLVKWADLNPMCVYPMESNLEIDLDWVKAKALFGHHNNFNMKFSEATEKVNSRQICKDIPGMEELNEIGSLEYRNFLFTAPDGRKILIWGSMPSVDQYNMLKGIHADIAILQRNTKNPEKLAKFAEATGAKVIIPHHMDLRTTREEYLPVLERSKAEYLRLVPDGQFIIPEHNEWYEF